MTHVRLLKKLAVVAMAGLVTLGLGAASASAATTTEKIFNTRPSGEISTVLQ
ncbi:MAG: hypothetical protein HOW71_00615 [Nonomuraea sp.]|nr:hypothetical protein [Nonomuraea sp.]NUP60660.1 hypothetical protein [Nonomuraea sp.]NUS06837.1 hypothetical protein [Nonomuraea sp.]